MLRNLAEPNRITRAVLVSRGYRDIVEHFDREEGPDGRWPQRARSTQLFYAQVNRGLIAPPAGIARAAFNPTNKLLQLTGALRKSILPAALRSNTRDVGRDSVEVFSNVEYSGKHDQGDPSSSLPQRKFMWLSSASLEDMAADIARIVFGK